jgi:anti-sigma B factor antagonist
MQGGRLPNRFGISVEEAGHITLVRVSGELVAQHEQELNEVVIDVVGNGAKEILMDLRKVSFIDSLGVRALIRNQLRARDGSFSFAVIPGRGQVFRVVKTMGLDRVLRVLDDGAVELPA